MRKPIDSDVEFIDTGNNRAKLIVVALVSCAQEPNNFGHEGKGKHMMACRIEGMLGRELASELEEDSSAPCKLKLARRIGSVQIHKFGSGSYQQCIRRPPLGESC